MSDYLIKMTKRELMQHINELNERLTDAQEKSELEYVYEVTERAIKAEKQLEEFRASQEFNRNNRYDQTEVDLKESQERVRKLERHISDLAIKDIKDTEE